MLISPSVRAGPRCRGLYDTPILLASFDWRAHGFAAFAPVAIPSSTSHVCRFSAARQAGWPLSAKQASEKGAVVSSASFEAVSKPKNQKGEGEQHKGGGLGSSDSQGS